MSQKRLAASHVLGLILMLNTWPLIGMAQNGANSPAPTRRNVIIFVADGLRMGSVNANDTPTLLRVRERGVFFVNSHSLFPTFTTPNASAIATGHYLGDTADFGNTLFTGFAIFDDGQFGKNMGTMTPFLENDQVLGDVNAHVTSTNYLNEDSLLALARKQGYSTAAIGKLGPVGIQDVSQLAPREDQFQIPDTVFIDDTTGNNGVPLHPEVIAALNRAGLEQKATPRVQPAGTVDTPGTTQSNSAQQQYFADVTTRAILPLFKLRDKPFALVYWSRDPDGSQHNQGDSLNKLEPGINGPTSKQGVADADANLKQILEYIENDPKLRSNTDIVVTSDHGFATISKHEIDYAGHFTRSYSTQFRYVDANNQAEVVPGWLPPGFLAIDLARALALPLFDPDSPIVDKGEGRYAAVDPTLALSTAFVRQRPVSGNGLLGGSGRRYAQTDATVIVAANGGSDLIYVPQHNPELVRKIIAFLRAQDYVGSLFVHSSYGAIDGALPLSAVNLEGTAQLPTPTIVVGFKSFSTDPKNPVMTAVQVADSVLQEGQGMHGGFGRDCTYNNMAAMGPDFKQGFVDPAPVSNADIMPTLVHLLGLNSSSKGVLQGRVLQEALVQGQDMPVFKTQVLTAKGAGGHTTVLRFQTLGEHKYFDEAGLIDARNKVAK